MFFLTHYVVFDAYLCGWMKHLSHVIYIPIIFLLGFYHSKSIFGDSLLTVVMWPSSDQSSLSLTWVIVSIPKMVRKINTVSFMCILSQLKHFKDDQIEYLKRPRKNSLVRMFMRNILFVKIKSL